MAQDNSPSGAEQRRPKAGHPVTVNTEPANTEALLPGTRGRRAHEPLLTMLLSSAQHPTSFYVRFCFKASFKTRICGCISTERTARAHTQRQPIRPACFLREAHPSLPVLRDSSPPLASALGPLSYTVKSLISSTDVQNSGTEYTVKRSPVHSLRTETGRQSVALSDPSWERARRRLCTPATCAQVALKAPGVWVSGGHIY